MCTISVEKSITCYGSPAISYMSIKLVNQELQLRFPHQLIVTGICHNSHKCIRYNCHVRVPFFITDEMDLAKTITGMFASSQGKRPCNICDCLFSSDVTVLGNLRDYIKLREVHNIVTFKLTSPATYHR